MKEADSLARRLTVFSPTGLSNRLRVLVSGLALAQASGRSFCMLWPKTNHCAASFQELFTNTWDVRPVSRAEIVGLPLWKHDENPDPPDLLANPAEEIVLGAYRSLVQADKYASHNALEQLCQDYFNQLNPIPEITRRVDTFWSERLDKEFIGVHLRRGDYLALRPDLMGNTQAAIEAVEQALEHLPGAKILLATDDGAPDPKTGLVLMEGVHTIFQKRFGKRVVWTTPRSLDRNRVESVQDALVDLWLLRQSAYFIGTVGSEFSRLAVYGRTIPNEVCMGGTPEYKHKLRLLKYTGLYFILRWLGKREFGRDRSMPFLIFHYSKKLRSFLRLKVDENQKFLSYDV